MGFRRVPESTIASLDQGEVEARLKRARRRLLEYRAHELHPRGRRATRAVEGHQAAHADDFKVSAKHGKHDPALHQAAMETAEAAVLALEDEHGPPPGRQPYLQGGV